MLCLFLSVVSALAGDFSKLRAELTCDGCNSYSDFVVVVQDVTRNPIGSFNVASDGSIDMYGIGSGTYTVAVKTRAGSTIHSEMLYIGANSAPVSIHISEEEVPKTVDRKDGDTVSVAQLRHKVPKHARKEYDKAEQAMSKRDVEGSLEHLKRATEIDPEYLEAHNNLGARLLMLGKTQDALNVLHHAAQIDPSSAFVQTNIAVALMTLQQYPEAEQAARRAISLQSNDPKARYVLALTLYGQRKFTPETVSLLQRSQEQFPNARIAFATVQASQGRLTEARSALKSYLNSGATDKRPAAESMLSQINKVLASSKVEH